MAVKADDKLKKVYFLEDERIMPLVEEVIKSCEGTNETIQIQLNTKGYDNRKDPKMTKDIVFPHKMRRDPCITVIGNESVKAVAESLDIPFILVSDFEGPGKEEQRNNVIRNGRYFILCADYQKAFNLRDILRKRKTHFMCPDVNKLATLYADLLHTYRMKVRDWFTISFPVGDCQMSPEQVTENIKYGVQFVADNLKKGPQSIKECFVKRTSGQGVKVN